MNERPVEHEVIVVLHAHITVGMEDDDVHVPFFGVETVDGIGWNDENLSNPHFHVVLTIARTTFTATAYDHADPDGRVRMGFLIRSRRHMQVVETGVALQHGMDKRMIRAAADVRETTFGLERTTERIHALVAMDADEHTPPSDAADASRTYDTEVIARADNASTAVMTDLHFTFSDETEVRGFLQKVIVGTRHKTLHSNLLFWRCVENAWLDIHRQHFLGHDPST